MRLWMWRSAGKNPSTATGERVGCLTDAVTRHRADCAVTSV